MNLEQNSVIPFVFLEQTNTGDFLLLNCSSLAEFREKDFYRAKISKPLRKKIHKKHGILNDYQYGSLPYSLQKILGKKEKTISLGSWQYIMDDCRKYSKNPIVRECRDYFAGKLNKDKDIIFDSSKVVSDYRNGSAHHTSKTIDEIMDDRKVIVDKINNVIDVFYT